MQTIEWCNVGLLLLLLLLCMCRLIVCRPYYSSIESEIVRKPNETIIPIFSVPLWLLLLLIICVYCYLFNIIIYILVFLGIIYLLLRFLANASSKKISKHLRKLIFAGSIILAIILFIGGKFLLSVPLTLLSLAVVKLKGLSIFQLIGLFRLIQTLRRSGRFSFNQNKNIKNSSTLSLEEAYKILNLDIKKRVTKDDVQKAHIKIQKKIHPDISPETARLSSIVNEAKDIVLKNIS